VHYYCADITENNCDVCATELGRVRKLVLVHRSYINTLLSNIEDVNTWDAGRTARKIFVYPNVQGEFDGGVPINVRGFASTEDMEVAKQYSLDVREPNYVGNRSHFNGINGARDYYVLWATETMLYASTRPVLVSVSAPVANDLKTEVVWQIKCRWTADDMPLQFTRNDSVLSCQYANEPISSGSFDDSFDNSFN